MRRTALGEVAPTAGLSPRLRDLAGARRPGGLEQALAQGFGLGDIEITASGTAALLIAFTALAQRSPLRRTVIIPAYTCPLVVLAAKAAGLRVVACDTTAGGFDLDPWQLAHAIDRDTLAVVPTHFGGWLADVGRIRRIAAAASAEIAIVEDAAQAFGATWGGRSVGLAGDVGIFSFAAGKGLTLYEGGALVAQSPDEMARLRAAAVQLGGDTQSGELLRAAQLFGYHFVYNPIGLGLVNGLPKRFWLGRGDDVRAASDKFSAHIDVHRVGSWRKGVACAALGRVPAHLATSRARFDALARRLSRIDGLKVHVPQPGALPSATFVFVTLPPTIEREATIARLWRSGLGVNKQFARAIGDYPDMAPLLVPGDTPNARALAAGTLAISTHPSMTPADEAEIFAALAACVA